MLTIFDCQLSNGFPIVNRKLAIGKWSGEFYSRFSFLLSASSAIECIRFCKVTMPTSL
jgi:hypothetical protein